MFRKICIRCLLFLEIYFLLKSSTTCARTYRLLAWCATDLHTRATGMLLWRDRWCVVGRVEGAVRRRGVSPCRSPVVESELNKTQHNARGSYRNKLLWRADTVTLFSQANKTSGFQWLSYYSLLPWNLSEECRRSAFCVDA